jgi:hypothetical protein
MARVRTPRSARRCARAGRSARPLAHLLLGAIDEGAMLVALADDGGLTRQQVGASVARFLEALRPRA